MLFEIFVIVETNKQKYIMIIDHDFTIRYCTTPPVHNTCPLGFRVHFMYPSPPLQLPVITLHYPLSGLCESSSVVGSGVSLSSCSILLSHCSHLVVVIGGSQQI